MEMDSIDAQNTLVEDWLVDEPEWAAYVETEDTEAGEIHFIPPGRVTLAFLRWQQRQ